MVTREDDGIWVTLEETIAVHHEEVFAMLTTEVGLTRWFCLSADIDCRAGGTIAFGWDENLERRSTVAILEYDPEGRITWDWYAGKDDRHAPVYWVIEPNVERGSIVKLRQGPFAADIDSLMSLANEAQMWRWYLCNMRSALEAKHDMRKVRPL